MPPPPLRASFFEPPVSVSLPSPPLRVETTAVVPVSPPLEPTRVSLPAPPSKVMRPGVTVPAAVWIGAALRKSLPRPPTTRSTSGRTLSRSPSGSSALAGDAVVGEVVEGDTDAAGAGGVGDGVGAAAAAERVAAAAAVEGVVPVVAEEVVGPAPAVDRVVAGSAVDGVTGRAGEQAVTPLAAVDVHGLGDVARGVQAVVPAEQVHGDGVHLVVRHATDRGVAAADHKLTGVEVPPDGNAVCLAVAGDGEQPGGETRRNRQETSRFEMLDHVANLQRYARRLCAAARSSPFRLI